MMRRWSVVVPLCILIAALSTLRTTAAARSTVHATSVQWSERYVDFGTQRFSFILVQARFDAPVIANLYSGDTPLTATSYYQWPDLLDGLPRKGDARLYQLSTTLNQARGIMRGGESLDVLRDGSVVQITDSRACTGYTDEGTCNAHSASSCQWNMDGGPICQMQTKGPPPVMTVPAQVKDPGSLFFAAMSNQPDLFRTAVWDPLILNYMIFTTGVDVVTGQNSTFTPFTADELRSGALRFVLRGVVNFAPHSYTVLTDAHGIPLNDITTLATVTYTEVVPDCDAHAMIAAVNGVTAALDSLAVVSDTDNMDNSKFAIGVYTASDAWFGCITLIEAASVWTETERVINSTICTEVYGSDAYAADPCCNRTLLATACCSTRPVVVTQEVVTGVNTTVLANECPTATTIGSALRLFGVVRQYGTSSASNNDLDTGCDAAVLAATGSTSDGDTSAIWDTLSSFMNDCNSAIWGQGGGVGATCQTDDDCYTKCVKTSSDSTSTGTCVVPTGDATPYVTACYYDRMKPVLRSFLATTWGVDPTDRAAFEAALLARTGVAQCTGPTGWMFSRGYYRPATTDELQQRYAQNQCALSNASVSQWTRCDDSTVRDAASAAAAGCTWREMVPAECLAQVQCNQFRDGCNLANQTVCLADDLNSSGYFCGSCGNNQGSCYEVSQPSRCEAILPMGNSGGGNWGCQPLSSITFDDSGCTALGGVVKVDGSDPCSRKWCSLSSRTTVDSCYDECTNNSTGLGYTIPHMCYRAVPVGTDCAGTVLAFLASAAKVQTFIYQSIAPPGQFPQTYQICVATGYTTSTDCSNNLDSSSYIWSSILDRFGTDADQRNAYFSSRCGSQPYCLIQGVANQTLCDALASTISTNTSTWPGIYWDSSAHAGGGGCLRSLWGTDSINHTTRVAACTTYMARYGYTAVTYEPRRFTPGAFNTNASCSASQCSFPWVSTSNCLSTSACNMQCTQCQSNFGSNYYVCTHTNHSSCNSGGSWDSTMGACIVSSTSQSDCTTRGYTVQTCGNRTLSGCPAADSLNCAVFQGSCNSEATCTAAGTCSDNELQNFQGPSSSPSSQTSSSVCVLPYSFNDNGYPYCASSPNVRWISWGCVDGSIASNSTCTTAGGTWAGRSLTHSTCVARKACYTSRGVNGMTTQEECEACGYTWRSIYTWTAGTWSTGELVGTYSWRHRTFGPVNSISISPDNQKLSTYVQQAIGKYVGPIVADALRCRTGRVASLLEHMACLCGTNVDTQTCGAILNNPITTDVAQRPVTCDQGGDVQSGAFSVTVDSDHLNCSTSSEVGVVLSERVLIPALTASDASLQVRGGRATRSNALLVNTGVRATSARAPHLSSATGTEEAKAVEVSPLAAHSYRVRLSRSQSAEQHRRRRQRRAKEKKRPVHPYRAPEDDIAEPTPPPVPTKRPWSIEDARQGMVIGSIFDRTFRVPVPAPRSTKVYRPVDAARALVRAMHTIGRLAVYEHERSVARQAFKKAQLAGAYPIRSTVKYQRPRPPGTRGVRKARRPSAEHLNAFVNLEARMLQGHITITPRTDNAANAVCYAWVVDGNNTMVGEMAGSCIDFTATSETGNVDICAALDSNIPRDSGHFPVKAFATIDPTYHTFNFTADSLTLTVATGSQICFTVSATGTYCPVYVADSWPAPYNSVMPEDFVLPACALDVLPAAILNSSSTLLAFAAYMRVTSQPTGGAAGPNLGTVTVTLYRLDGNVETDASGVVTAYLTDGNASAVLLGSTRQVIVNGVATFTDLGVNLPGENYRLVFTAGTLPVVDSNAFNVTAGAVAGVVILSQPEAVSMNTTACLAVFNNSITIGLVDAWGNVVPTANNVTVSLTMTMIGLNTTLILNPVGTVKSALGLANVLPSLNCTRSFPYNGTHIEQGEFTASINNATLSATTDTFRALVWQDTTSRDATPFTYYLTVNMTGVSCTAHHACTPAIPVFLHTLNGSLLTGPDDIVITASLHDGPAGTVLSGELSTTPYTFSTALFQGVAFSRAGAGNRLQFYSPGVGKTVSVAFNVHGVASLNITNTSDMSAVTHDDASIELTALVLDETGSVYSGADVWVVVTIASLTGNPTAVLTGTARKKTAGGAATFTGLSISEAGGTGFQLAVMVEGEFHTLTRTAAFDVAGPPTAAPTAAPTVAAGCVRDYTNRHHCGFSLEVFCSHPKYFIDSNWEKWITAFAIIGSVFWLVPAHLLARSVPSSYNLLQDSPKGGPLGPVSIASLGIVSGIVLFIGLLWSSPWGVGVEMGPGHAPGATTDSLMPYWNYDGKVSHLGSAILVGSATLLLCALAVLRKRSTDTPIEPSVDATISIFALILLLGGFLSLADWTSGTWRYDSTSTQAVTYLSLGATAAYHALMLLSIMGGDGVKTYTLDWRVLAVFTTIHAVSASLVHLTFPCDGVNELWNTSQ